MYTPLPARLRPVQLEDMVGQEHLLAPGRPLRNLIETGQIPNMIFYGPAGVGKTTLAGIIAARTDRKLYKLNATTASSENVKEVLAQIGSLEGEKGLILYLDEIQYFNKKQQQLLLDAIENGSVTLIASTSENPYFYIYTAILSRCTVFEFRPLSREHILTALRRGVRFLEQDRLTVEAEPEALEHIAATCGGDLRKALNTLEVLAARKTGQTVLHITLENARAVTGKANLRYDRDGDSHYDILSAFQKSIRGSDPDAAIHYLARLIAAEDLPSICRRLLVIAAEDIGLAFPQAIAITKACTDAAAQLGFPEAQIPLAEAVLLLATAPKSNSAADAIGKAMKDLQNTELGEIPAALKDAHYSGAEALGNGKGYQYPHAFPDHYVKQQYLPNQLKNAVYYTYGSNKNEQAAKAYWEKIKGKKV